jgi:hypothetical protein
MFRAYLVTIVYACIMILGISLRLTQLSSRTVFSDENYTQLRVAGNTAAELMHSFYNGRPFTPRALRRQTIVNADSTPARLIASLEQEDAQHPPLFYLIELAFTKFLGNTLFAWRLPSALFGIGAIIAAFALARELFKDTHVGFLAAALFAVSPIERIYSDQAREYSLLVLFVLLATFAVVKAMRVNPFRSSSTIRAWAIYAILLIAGLYTSPFMMYVMAAHGFFALGTAWKDYRKKLYAFAATSAAALVAYTPWLCQIYIHWKTIVDDNDWTAGKWPLGHFVTTWIFNAGSTFFDIQYMYNLRWEFSLVLLVVAIVVVRAFREADNEARWLLGAGIVVPALVLIVPDILFSQHRSLQARYGLPICAMLTIVAARGTVRQPLLQAFMLTVGVIACAIGSLHQNWWDNDVNRNDAGIASAINTVPHAQVVSTIIPPLFIGFANFLADDVPISLSPKFASVQFSSKEPVFAVRPSDDELHTLQTLPEFTYVPAPFPQAPTPHYKQGKAEIWELFCRVNNVKRSAAIKRC